jgi:hypothetical protein
MSPNVSANFEKLVLRLSASVIRPSTFLWCKHMNPSQEHWTRLSIAAIKFAIYEKWKNRSMSVVVSEAHVNRNRSEVKWIHKHYLSIHLSIIQE